jgi:hypothetical protein
MREPGERYGELMFKVIQVDESGAELAAIELDDFVIETVYAGIATLLRAAATSAPGPSSPPELSRAARQRREKILTRLHG